MSLEASLQRYNIDLPAARQEYADLFQQEPLVGIGTHLLARVVIGEALDNVDPDNKTDAKALKLLDVYHNVETFTAWMIFDYAKRFDEGAFSFPHYAIEEALTEEFFMSLEQRSILYELDTQLGMLAILLHQENYKHPPNDRGNYFTDDLLSARRERGRRLDNY